MSDQPPGPPSAPDAAGRAAPRAPRVGSAGERHRRLEHLAHAFGADDDLPIDPELGPDDESRPSPEHRRPAVPVHHHRAHPVVLGAIFVGGFLGTLGRYGVGHALPSASGHFPTATFVVNTSGALVLGLALTVLLERLRRAPRLLRPFAVTGVLGGWTTYSSLIVGTVTIGHLGHLALAAGYLAVTLLCGVTGVALGIGVARSRRLDALGNVAPDAWVPVGGDAGAADLADDGGAGAVLDERSGARR